MALQLSTAFNGKSQTWPLEGAVVRVGRGSGNDVQLLDATVSKEHAELTSQSGRWSVRDLGSRNGTRVNGHDASSPIPVSPGDRIEIGHVVLVVGEAGRPAMTRIVTSENVDSSLKLKVKELLERPTAGEGTASRVLHVLAEAGQLLVLPRPLAETCEAILVFIEKTVKANRLVMLMRDPQTGELSQVAARYRGGRASEPLALSQSITRAVLAENTAVITADAANDPRFLAQHSIIAQAIHSAMAVPLFDNEQVLGLLYVDTSDPTVTYGQPDLELLTLLGNMAAVKITNARLLEAEQVRQRLAQEVATAARIQRNFLQAPPEMPGWHCHARIEPSLEVGGDLFDFYVRADGQVVVLVGDVSGKGMGAALLMSSTITSSRVLYDECEGPLQLVRRLNAILFRSTEARSFVTLFAGWLDPVNGRLRYVNAGHPEPVIARAGRTRGLEATGIPVAMLPDFAWQAAETTLEKGELFVLFSDGVSEAQRGTEFFDDDPARVPQAVLAAEREPDVERGAERIIARIDEFAAGAHRADDVTLVLLRRD